MRRTWILSAIAVSLGSCATPSANDAGPNVVTIPEIISLHGISGQLKQILAVLSDGSHEPLPRVSDATYRGAPTEERAVLKNALDSLRNRYRILVDNIANADTVAFKRREPDSGRTDMSPGRLRRSGRQLDLAVHGAGFFKLLLPDGTFAYTRHGRFEPDANGRVVTPQGLPLEPQIQLPLDTVRIDIDASGVVTIKQASCPDVPTKLVTLRLTRFSNPSRLERTAAGHFLPSITTGTPIDDKPGNGGMGWLRQGFIEESNVDGTHEIVRLRAIQEHYAALRAATLGAPARFSEDRR